MSPVARAIVRMYPARWRERYAAEFFALMEDLPPSWRTNVDLLKGVVRMQLFLPRFRNLAMALSFAGLVLGTAVSFLVTPQYISRATMMYDPRVSLPADQRNALVDRIIEEEGVVFSRTSLSLVIQNPNLDLYRAERQSRPIDEVIETMRSAIRVTLQHRPDTSVCVFEIAFLYRDALKAQATVQAVVNRFYEEDQRRDPFVANATVTTSSDARIAALERRIAALEAGGKHTGAPAILRRAEPAQLNVVDPPSFPPHPLYPNRRMFGLAGLAIGFVFALLIALFRRRPAPIAAIPNAGAIG